MIKKVNGHVMFTDAFYQFIKKAVQIYIPAFASLYFGLGKIWDFPAIEQVCGSCALIATFVGVCIGISKSSYNESDAAYDGEITVKESVKTGKKTYSLDLYGNPEEIIDSKDSITLKIPASIAA